LISLLADFVVQDELLQLLLLLTLRFPLIPSVDYEGAVAWKTNCLELLLVSFLGQESKRHMVRVTENRLLTTI
jgi:hypothetical protein